MGTHLSEEDSEVSLLEREGGVEKSNVGGAFVISVSSVGSFEAMVTDILDWLPSTIKLTLEYPKNLSSQCQDFAGCFRGLL